MLIHQLRALEARRQNKYETVRGSGVPAYFGKPERHATWNEVLVPYGEFISQLTAILVPAQVPTPEHGLHTLLDEQARVNCIEAALRAAHAISEHLDREVPLLSIDARLEAIEAPIGLLPLCKPMLLFVLWTLRRMRACCWCRCELHTFGLSV